MNCFNCGASVTGEHKNCPFCGQSMQIVPDYNFLDDENINVLMEESAPVEKEKNVDQEAAERIRARKQREREREKKRQIEKKKQRQLILILVAVVAICAIVFAAFFTINDMLRERNEASYDYQIKQAEEALKENDFASAKNYYYKALNLRPNDLEVRFTLANLYSERKMYDDMIATYKDIIKLDAKNYTAYKMLFQHYNSLGDVDAIMDLRKGVTDNRIMALFQDYAVENPMIYQKGGTFTGALDVMVTAKLGYEIYYSVDGSDPSKNGTLYTGTIRIDKSGMTTLKVVAKNEKGIYSNIVQETYYIEHKAPDAPVIKPEGVFTFDAETYLEVIVPSGCTAYYAWDLDEKIVDIRAEDANRLAYVDGIRIPSGSHKLTLVIIDNTSGMASIVYRQFYTCTLEGIPVPEQFIEKLPEEPVDTEEENNNFEDNLEGNPGDTPEDNVDDNLEDNVENNVGNE